jgi:radical SAM enzyme (TIGR01210 family)
MQKHILRKQIRDYLTRLREQARQQNQPRLVPLQLKQVVFTEARKGYLDGQYVDRFVLFMRGTGCTWVSQTGGCTFCGFWDATNFGDKIEDADNMAQVLNVINDDSVDFDHYPIICLYNDGSMLVEDEISFQAVLDICEMLAKRPHVRRIVLEAKIVDVTEDKISRLTRVMNSKELEVAMGFESADEVVRDLCINKTFSDAVFRSKMKILSDHGVSFVPLVMVKPPFLTEAQAIRDVVNTLQYLEEFNLQRIDLELATVEEHTIVYDLWQHGLYTTPRLWSVIEILKQRDRLNLKTPVFLSPPNYTATAKAYSSNCAACNEPVAEALKAYNRLFSDSSIFDSLDCSCKRDWEETTKQDSPDVPLLDQIELTFKELLRRGHNLEGEARQ